MVAVEVGDGAKGRRALEQSIALFADAGDVSGVVLLLDGMSGLAVAEERPLQAIRLAGAAAALQASSGADLAEQTMRFLGRERLTKGDTIEAEAAWAEGQAMSLEQAVECALRQAESPAASAR
jgi:hypothetical protein